ncbi:MAG: GDYXXLXY domain-containing protein [Verrucomicrobiota bacterium]|jgi:uncharacterized membrane-anchored protein|nr:GDYXXLXY domain-containing protein [Verrucomicrobiota bacterium]
MKKTVLFGLLLLGVAAQFGVVASMIVTRELTLRRGKAFTFETAPIDPFDPFRGKYVTLNITAINRFGVKTDDATFRKGDIAYLAFEEGTNGLATVSGAARRPAGDHTLKVRVRWANDETDSAADSAAGKTQPRPTRRKILHFRDLPIERYYLPEDIAPLAEAAYANAARRSRGGGNEKPAAVVVRVWRGNAVIEDLLIGGLPIRDFLKQQTDNTPTPPTETSP